MRRWVARHPVASFLVLTFGLAYPAMSLPILASHGVLHAGWTTEIAVMDTERVASIFLVFVALVPATTLVTWASDGVPGLRALARRALRWDFGARWWLLVLAGLPLLTLGLALLLGDTLRPVEIAPFAAAQVFGLLVNLVLINIWEEAGWAGFVQTRLERSHRLATAALLTAVPFALVHMPLHFIGDFSLASVMTALITLLIVCALVRLMLGVVLRGTRDSILAVALMHTMFNRSNNEEGIVAGLVGGDGRKLAGLLAVLIMTAVVSVAARHRLSRSHRLLLDAPTDQPQTRTATAEDTR